MKEQMLQYQQYIEKVLACEDVKDWSEIRREYLVRIQFYQHERLIHLIVTVTFAILTVMSVFAVLITQIIELLALTLLFLVLLVPYIRHYYFLENYVQKMYTIYDKILLKMKKSNEI